MIENVTPAEETAVLLKFGSKNAAIIYWWGRFPTPEDEWELNVCKVWQHREWRGGKRG